MVPCVIAIPGSVFSALFWGEEVETEVNVHRVVVCHIR